MPESFVDTQVRLVLQQQAGALCKYLDEAFLMGAFEFDLSAIVFDFGDKGDAAYGTSLPIPTLVETVKALVASMTGGPARMSPRGLTPDFLRSLADAAKEFLPAGVGFALIVGDASASAYVSNADRSDVLVMFETEFLPKLRGECFTRRRADP